MKDSYKFSTENEGFCFSFPSLYFFNSFVCSSTDSVRLGEKLLNFKAKLVSLLVINKTHKNNEGY